MICNSQCGLGLLLNETKVNGFLEAAGINDDISV